MAACPGQPAGCRGPARCLRRRHLAIRSLRGAAPVCLRRRNQRADRHAGRQRPQVQRQRPRRRRQRRLPAGADLGAVGGVVLRLRVRRVQPGQRGRAAGAHVRCARRQGGRRGGPGRGRAAAVRWPARQGPGHGAGGRQRHPRDLRALSGRARGRPAGRGPRPRRAPGAGGQPARRAGGQGHRFRPARHGTDAVRGAGEGAVHRHRPRGAADAADHRLQRTAGREGSSRRAFCRPRAGRAAVSCPQPVSGQLRPRQRHGSGVHGGTAGLPQRHPAHRRRRRAVPVGRRHPHVQRGPGAAGRGGGRPRATQSVLRPPGPGRPRPRRPASWRIGVGSGVAIQGKAELSAPGRPL